MPRLLPRRFLFLVPALWALWLLSGLGVCLGAGPPVQPVQPVQAEHFGQAVQSVQPEHSGQAAPVAPVASASPAALASPAAPASPTALAAAPLSSARVDDVVLDYRDTGEARDLGRPLLLITGWAVTMDQWDRAFVERLAARRRVVLMDNRGMGRTALPVSEDRADSADRADRADRADSPLTIGRMALDAAGLLDALGIAKADVLGWSMGGMIAQELALARPELVAKLALYATQPDAQGLVPALNRMAAMTPEEFRRAQFPAAWTAAHPDIFARLPKPARPLDPAVIAWQYAAMAAWEGVLARLPDLRQPTLLLVGDQDDVCPPEASRRLAERLPNARLTVLPQAGHWMMHQYPEEMARLVGAFLEQGEERP